MANAISPALRALIRADRTPAPPSQGRTYWEIATLDEIPDLLENTSLAMQCYGFPESDVFAMRLAMEEALVNGVKHGNQLDPDKCVRIRLLCTSEWVKVEIEDQGAGYDGPDVPDPLAVENMEKSSGRGLLLMKAYVSWIYHNERRNCVTMVKVRANA